MTKEEFEAQLQRYLAKRDAVVVTRQMLMDLVRHDWEAVRVAETLLMVSKR